MYTHFGSEYLGSQRLYYTTPKPGCMVHSRWRQMEAGLRDYTNSSNCLWALCQVRPQITASLRLGRTAKSVWLTHAVLHAHLHIGFPCPGALIILPGTWTSFLAPPTCCQGGGDANAKGGSLLCVAGEAECVCARVCVSLSLLVCHADYGLVSVHRSSEYRQRKQV